MPRESKLNPNANPKQKPVAELLGSILEDIDRTAAMTVEEQRALSPLWFAPLAIPAGRDHLYLVSRAGLDAAYLLTVQVWKSRERVRQIFTRQEFEKQSLEAIGEAIMKRAALASGATSPSGAELLAQLADDYESVLTRISDKTRSTVNRHIPCHLFHADQNVPTFAIRPIQFRPRDEWIAKFVADPIELTLIREVQSGARALPELLGAEFDGEDRVHASNAWNTLIFLGNFRWIATIEIVGHELGQSQYKASLLVGLAIDALGSRFQAHEARRFVKSGRNHLSAENQLATTEDGRFLRGSTTEMPALGSAPGLLAAKVAAERPFLDAAGLILQVYLEGRQTGKAPHLVERWANAVYWFGEARREASDFMAVVDYGCAADGLSRAAGVAKEMVKFATAALDPKATPLKPGEMSIDEAVTAVYRDGRNKLAHGEMPGLLEDRYETRRIGDALLVNLLDVVTFELAVIISNRKEVLEVDEDNAYRALAARLTQRP